MAEENVRVGIKLNKETEWAEIRQAITEDHIHHGTSHAISRYIIEEVITPTLRLRALLRDAGARYARLDSVVDHLTEDEDRLRALVEDLNELSLV